MSSKIDLTKVFVSVSFALALLLIAARGAQADSLVSWDFSGLDYTAFADNTPVPNPILTPAEANPSAGLSVSDLTSVGLTTSTGNLIAGEGNFTVNNKRATNRSLEAGDVIRVEGVTMVFDEGDDSRSSTAE